MELDVLVMDQRYNHLGLPEYATTGSAGLDLRAMRSGINEAAIGLSSELLIRPHSRRLIGTGLCVRIRDPHFVGIVASRSGMSLNHGVRVAQGIGVIDSDYTHEIGVILANDSDQVFYLKPQQRIAQLLIQPVHQVVLRRVDAVEQTGRTGGYGSTGVA